MQLAYADVTRTAASQGLQLDGAVLALHARNRAPAPNP